MTWTAGADKSTGNLITAAIWNSYLGATGSLEFLHDKPCCRVYNDASIEVANASVTALTFNSERYDTDTMHSTSSNQGRITFTTAGKYLVIGQVVWAVDSTGYRYIQIKLNGSTVIADVRQDACSSYTSQIVTTVYDFAATNYVELIAYQTSGDALDAIVSANFSPEFSACWLSA